MKKILVTGGAGFLGSHLCERLLSEGNDVLCVDNFFTGSKDNLVHLKDNPRFEVMRDWHERQGLPTDSFVIADGLHMNDWGYACFAQLLGDDIIRSVGQIKLGVNVPGLDGVLMAGWPGTRAALWQQAGRAGRTGSHHHQGSRGDPH